MTTSGSGRSRFPLVLFAAFFLSGAAALVYQVLWTRRLGLVLGVTVQAASTVLACFMAGLAIGSYVAGRRSDRIANPLKAFAIVELLIGIAGLLTPFALSAVESIVAVITPSLPDQILIKTGVRVISAALVLVVPAALMGATYPLVLQAMSRTPDGLRRGASLLYGVNTAGAVLGVLAGSLWLVPTLGIRLSFVVAAALNVVVAVTALAVASRVSLGGHAESETANTGPPAEASRRSLSPPSAAARTAVLVVIAVSGAVSLALEIIWFRVLVFFLRPTTYAFASMLATVLIGLAAGSLLATPLLRRRANWLAVLAILELGIALAALVSAFLMIRSYDLMEWMWTWTWMPKPYDFVLPLMASAGMAILPAALLLGAAFPLGLLLWTEPADASEAESVGGRAGTLYALNVAGAIAGSFAAGFVLLPLLGSQTSLVLVSAVPLAGGCVLLAYSKARGWLPTAAAGVIAFAGIALVLPDLFRDVIVRRYDQYEVLWHREDAQAAVSVIADGAGGRVLLIDGMHHASDGTVMVGGHHTIGALAVAVHPHPRNILVVGLGGGATAGAASVLPGAFTEVVELSPSVIAAAPWFERTNGHIRRNPRVRFRVDDGRNYLQRSGGRFDIITADLLLPQMAGAANLYSADYYEIARRALAPGGIMVQWLDGSNEERYKLLLRSFASVFPHVTLWHAGGIAIGSNEPLQLARSSFAEKIRSEGVRQMFAGVGLDSFESLLDHYLGGLPEIRAYVGDGPVLTDDKPTIEYFLSMPREGPQADIDRLRGDRQNLAIVETP